MIYICKPQRVKLYINKGRKTAAQVKAETGCTAIINSGLFDMASFSPVAQLRADGKTLVNENWGTNYGYAWGDTGGIRLSAAVDADRNFIGCVCLVRDGKAVDKLNCPPDMQYATSRTAIGTFADGRMWVYCTEVPLKPEQLRDIAVAAEVRDTVMLDGGGSTQCITPTGTISSTRIVHNFICIYAEEKEDKPVSNKIKVYLSPSSQPANLYAAGNTNEQAQCRRIAAFCKAALDRCGFDCIIGDAEIDFTGRTTESNKWGADYHIPIHTNAGGGHGVVCFVYSDKALAQPVYDAINAIAPFKTAYGVRVEKTLYEVKNTAAKCIYVEAAFHDNAPEAEWIIDHARDIGEAICNGLCQTAGVEYVPGKADAALTLEQRVERLEKLLNVV